MPRLSLVPVYDSANSRPSESIHFDVAHDGASVEIEVDGHRLRFDAADLLDVLESMKRRGAR